MNINDSFPSKYMKAADIDGSPIYTIKHVEEEEVGRDGEYRPVVYFEGQKKGVVLNKTNATNIANLYGYETDEWVGKDVMLQTAWVDFQGKSTESIRIYPPKRQGGQQGQQQRQQGGRSSYGEQSGGSARQNDRRSQQDDTEIPF